METKVLYYLNHINIVDKEVYNLYDMSISKDYSIIEDNFSDNVCIESLGKTSFQKKDNNRSYVFQHLAQPEKKNVDNSHAQITLAKNMDYVALHLDDLIFFLWFIKDNCVSFSDGYGRAINKIPEGLSHHFLSVTNTSSYSTCSGEFQDSDFSESQIMNARLILNKYKEICPPKPYKSRPEYEKWKESSNIDIITKGSDLEINYNDNNRIERAIFFLREARKTYHLIHKISLYVPILECLFSTEASEATQKVSERVSFYLAKVPNERKQIFKIVRDAYNIRSKYVHGSKLDSSQRSYGYLLNIAKEVDDIVRSILVRVIMIDSDKFLGKKESKDKEKEIKEFLSNLIFQ